MRVVPVLLTTGLFWVGNLAWAQVPGMGVGGAGTGSSGQQVDGGGGGMNPVGGGAGGVTG